MKSRLIVIAAAIAALVSISAKAQETENVKTGLNFGPLPAVAYDADKGFQLGALLNIYNYGDGPCIISTTNSTARLHQGFAGL